VFGLHRGAGDPMRGECGYIASWKVTGIAYSLQPAAFTLPAGLRGKWRKNKYGEWEVWAYHELRLRIPLRADEVLAMGPPRPHWAGKPRKRPPLEVVDLTREIEKAERDWFPDEVTSVAELPTEHVSMPPATAEHAAQLDELAVVIAEADPGGVREAEPAPKPVPAWLMPPTAAAIKPNPGEGAAIVERIKGSLRILADYVEASSPMTSTTPTAYGSGNLTVHRAQEETPLTPRLRRALELFQAAARARDRGSPDKPPE
jgi:hypothetical protein